MAFRGPGAQRHCFRRWLGRLQWWVLRQSKAVAHLNRHGCYHDHAMPFSCAAAAANVGARRLRRLGRHIGCVRVLLLASPPVVARLGGSVVGLRSARGDVRPWIGKCLISELGKTPIGAGCMVCANGTGQQTRGWTTTVLLSGFGDSTEPHRGFLAGGEVHLTTVERPPAGKCE
jgi:hypothetical protein